jgi:hypothetical protein
MTTKDELYQTCYTFPLMFPSHVMIPCRYYSLSLSEKYYVIDSIFNNSTAKLKKIVKNCLRRSGVTQRFLEEQALSLKVIS